MISATSIVELGLQNISEAQGRSVDCSKTSSPCECEKNKAFGDNLHKVTSLVGALTAYAASYATDLKGDPSKEAQAHDARKKAIESLIDANTDRTGKGGKVVFSLGTAVGASYGQRWANAPNQDATVPGLSLPMGFALQVLPSRDQPLAGFHLQVSLVDLGQFLTYNQTNSAIAPPRPDAPFMVGGELGWLIGTPSNGFVLGVDARYAPTALAVTQADKSTKMGAAFLGGFAAYYVPFFDFN